MKEKLPLILRVAAILLSAFSMMAAFPPFQSTNAVWMSLTLLILLARLTEPGRSFWWGFACGMVFWLGNLHWILMLSKTGGQLVLAIIGWMLLAAYCALYFGMFTMVTAYLFQKWIEPLTAQDVRKPEGQAGNEKPRAGMFDLTMRNIGMLFIVPLLWVGFEYLRSTLFTGFSWNQLGVSQYKNLGLIQIAEWGGVYAVSAVIVLGNMALVEMVIRFFRMSQKKRVFALNMNLVIALALIVLCWQYGSRRCRELAEGRAGDVKLEAVVIQPGIPQLQKWPEKYAQEVGRKISAKGEEAAALKPDIMILPETAIPDCVVLSDPETGMLAGEIASKGVPLLVGVIEARQAGNEVVYYNSSLLYGPDGKIVDVYHKRHLVLFGEYLPFERQIKFLKMFAPLGFSCEAGTQSTVFRLQKPKVNFSTLICFEDAFPYLSREAVKNGARLLIDQTNDAWFDGTAASVQHMSHCVFRCIENRVSAVRAANTGVSCFIDYSGWLDEATSLTLRDTAVVEPESLCRKDTVYVRPDNMVLTFYTRFGDTLFAMPCGVLALAAFVLVLGVEKRKNKLLQNEKKETSKDEPRG